MGELFRVVMAVANPGSTDNRVAKSAEAAHKAGYECHVVGVHRDGFPEFEEINGVLYHRVPIQKGARCLIAGLCPSPHVLNLLRFNAQEDEHVPAGLTAALLLPLRVVWRLLAMLLAFVRALVLYVPPRFLRTFVRLLTRRTSLSRIRCELGKLAAGFRSIAREEPGIRSFFRACAATLLRAMGAKPMLRRLGLPDPMKRSGTRKAIRADAMAPTQLSKGHRAFFAGAFVSIAARGARHVRAFLGGCPESLASRRGRYVLSLYHKLTELNGDLYHAHELCTLEACKLAAKAAGAKIVYDSHELESHRNVLWKPRVRRKWTQHEERNIRHADAVITVSEGCATALKRAYGLPAVTVVRNTPLLPGDPAGAELRKSLGLGPGEPLIVYVGLVTFNRGLEQAVAALRLLPGYVLATVGPWREETHEELLDHARRHGVQDRFFMHNKVPPDELVHFISSADLGIALIQNACLSYYYCLPSKLFECAFAGLPIVASNFPDMRMFVRENEVGEVCDETDPDSIADAIRTVYNSRGRYFTPQKVARLWQEHSFEQESGKLIALYEGLRRTGGGGPALEPGRP